MVYLCIYKPFVMKINVFLMFKRANSVPLFKLIFSDHKIEIVGCSNDVSTAMRTLLECAVKPDVVLMDAKWTCTMLADHISN